MTGGRSAPRVRSPKGKPWELGSGFYQEVTVVDFPDPNDEESFQIDFVIIFRIKHLGTIFNYQRIFYRHEDVAAAGFDS